MFTRLVLSLVLLSSPFTVQAAGFSDAELCEKLTETKRWQTELEKKKPVEKRKVIELSCEDKTFMRLSSSPQSLQEIKAAWKDYLAAAVRKGHCTNEKGGFREAIKNGWTIGYKITAKGGEVYEHNINCRGV